MSLSVSKNECILILLFNTMATRCPKSSGLARITDLQARIPEIFHIAPTLKQNKNILFFSCYGYLYEFNLKFVSNWCTAPAFCKLLSICVFSFFFLLVFRAGYPSVSVPDLCVSLYFVDFVRTRVLWCQIIEIWDRFSLQPGKKYVLEKTVTLQYRSIFHFTDI